MRWIKGILKGLGVLLAALVLVVIGLYLTDPPYWKRLATAPIGEVWRTGWYSPQERVPGVVRDDIVLGPPEDIDPSALAAAQQYADETQSVALLVWHKGALRYERYGKGFDRDTRTETSSAHKTVVGLLTGAAIADGYIKSIEQPAADFLPEWDDEARKKITIGHLLTMSSGLEVISGMNPAARGMKLMLGGEINRIVMPLRAVQPAGEVFEYANTNPQFLGTVISRATGKRYAEYLSERLWSRLGAGDAAVWLDSEGGTPRTFCCLFTTARGWLRVGLLLLNQGRVGNAQVIPAEWVAAQLSPSAANPNYGYLTWLGSPPGTERTYNSKNPLKAFHSEPFVAPDVAFIDGFGGQRVYVVPSEQLIIVRTGKAQLKWDDARLPNTILRGLRKGGQVP